MKSCPTCNRTYADETLTYCLADGSLLSAPYDPEATQRIPTRSTDPPPTEVLPSRASHREPAKQPSKSQSVYIVIALLALIVGVGIVALLKSGAKDISSANLTNTAASTPSTNSPKPTPKRQRTEPITIPLMSYVSANWDEYNPGFTGRDAQHAVNIWMRAKGYITYRVTMPEIQEDTAIILVRLSSELDDEYARNPTPADSSDVTLIINSNRQETKNVIADDGFGKDYQWVVPANNLHAGSNEITLRVGDGTHNNGITIHTPIRISFQ